MPSSHSDRLRLELMEPGENEDTWGERANTGIELIEEAIAGVASLNVAGTGDYTLSTSNAATDEARKALLSCTGTLTGARNVIVPAKEKIYYVSNGTSGAYDLTVKTSGGTGIAVPQGMTQAVYCDGTNVLALSAPYVATGFQQVRTTDSPTFAGLTVSGNVSITGTATVDKAVIGPLPLLGQAVPTELTIASGAVVPTSTTHTIDTESDASTDDLTNITTTNLPAGSFLHLRAANTARTVVLKNAAGGAGQIHLASDTDLSLTDDEHSILLQRIGADWFEVARTQLSAPTGTKMLFYQASPPPGWTQDTSVNDKVLRVVSGSGGGSGGSWTFSGLTVNNFSLTTTYIPAHSHVYLRGGAASTTVSPSGSTGPVLINYVSTSTNIDGGSGFGHNHSTSHDGNWRPAYIDVIAATKD